MPHTHDLECDLGAFSDRSSTSAARVRPQLRERNEQVEKHAVILEKRDDEILELKKRCNEMGEELGRLR